jgi:hypothetical protein
LRNRASDGAKTFTEVVTNRRQLCCRDRGLRWKLAQYRVANGLQLG